MEDHYEEAQIDPRMAVYLGGISDYSNSESEASDRRVSGWPMPPNFEPPSIPEGLVPTSRIEFVQSLPAHELKELLTPVKHGILSGNTMYSIKDARSGISVYIKADDVLGIVSAMEDVRFSNHNEYERISAWVTQAEQNDSIDLSTVPSEPAEQVQDQELEAVKVQEEPTQVVTLRHEENTPSSQVPVQQPNRNSMAGIKGFLRRYQVLIGALFITVAILVLCVVVLLLVI